MKRRVQIGMVLCVILAAIIIFIFITILYPSLKDPDIDLSKKDIAYESLSNKFQISDVETYELTSENKYTQILENIDNKSKVKVIDSLPVKTIVWHGPHSQYDETCFHPYTVIFMKDSNVIASIFCDEVVDERLGDYPIREKLCCKSMHKSLEAETINFILTFTKPTGWDVFSLNRNDGSVKFSYPNSRLYFFTFGKYNYTPSQSELEDLIKKHICSSNCSLEQIQSKIVFGEYDLFKKVGADYYSSAIFCSSDNKVYQIGFFCSSADCANYNDIIELFSSIKCPK